MSHSFERALRDQPTLPILPPPLNTYVPAALLITGQVLVLSSTWALGITGTFLGDYFGILMDKRVEGFPFNVVDNPMYIGSTLCFIAGSLWYDHHLVFLLAFRKNILTPTTMYRVEKPAGLLVSLFVYLVYSIALRFEGLD